MYKLLIADDNNTHIQCALDYVNWKELNFTQIKTASNGADAYEIFREFEPDLVITDVVMPVMNGPELAKRIRKTSNVHIIFMSCYEDFNYVKEAIDNDITAYILKPLNPDVLKEKVLKVVHDIKAREDAADSARTLSEFLPLVRESLLYRLLYNESAYVPKDILRSARFDDSSLALIVKYIILNNSESCVSLCELQSTIKAAFPNFSVNAVTEVPNKLIVLLTAPQTEEEDFLCAAIDTIRHHIESICSEYGFDVAVGVSNVFSTLSDAGVMLKQAALALESTDAPETGEIYLFEDFEESAYESPDYDIYNLKQDLSLLLDKADSSAVEEFMQKYYPQNMILNRNTIKALCFSTVTSLQFLMSERNADIDDLFEHSNVIWAKLNNFETIADTYQWLKNILLACCDFISNVEKRKYNGFVGHIKSYIDIHYKDIASVEQIASELFISAGYAKNVFKKYTGQTIFDYLVETRIKEAKRLLSDPTIKVYEVSEMVGYISKAHFTETFKRKTGMTPKEYQLKGK